MENENNKKKMPLWLQRSLKGLAIGGGCIIPGVSGGTVAVLLNVYNEIVDNVANLFKNFVKCFLVLLPYAISIVLSIAMCWIPFKYATTYALFLICCLFAGLIAGGVPSISKSVKVENVRKRDITALVITFLLAISFGLLSIFFSLDSYIEVMFQEIPFYLYIIIFFVGLLASVALVVPGISGSIIMLILGFYKPLLGLVDNFLNGVNIGQTLLLLVSMAIGIAVGFILCSKLMSWLLAKHNQITNFAIFGFIIGSVIGIFVNQDMFVYLGILTGGENTIQLYEWFVGPVLALAGAVGAYFLFKFADKKKEEANA